MCKLPSDEVHLGKADADGERRNVGGVLSDSSVASTLDL
jgi:hypothetical protein